jgi:hypothetical protein
MIDNLPWKVLKILVEAEICLNGKDGGCQIDKIDVKRVSHRNYRLDSRRCGNYQKQVLYREGPERFRSRGAPGGGMRW